MTQHEVKVQGDSNIRNQCLIALNLLKENLKTVLVLIMCNRDRYQIHSSNASWFFVLLQIQRYHHKLIIC